MARWQFEPRIGHTLDLEKAKHIARHYKPKEAWPIMKGPETVRNGPHKGEPRRWTGTNQPRTVTFTSDLEEARIIRFLYGEDLVFIRDRETYRNTY